MAKTTDNLRLILPDDWSSRAADERLRWCVAVQRRLIDAHNAEGDIYGFRGAEWQRRMRELWMPRIYALAPVIAGARESVEGRTLVKPGPDEESWYYAERARHLIAETLTADELAAGDPESVFAGGARAAEPPDPYEDLTDATEVDPNNDLSWTTTRCTFDTVRRDASVYAYLDYGAGHFGDFEHLHEAYISDTENLCHVGTWVVTNNPDDLGSLANGLRYTWYTDPSAPFIVYLKDEDNDNYDQGAIWYEDTHYFVTTTRSSTTATAVIRTGSHSGTIQDTLSITCETTTYRYLMPFLGRGASSGSEECSGWCQNYDLQEAVGAIAPPGAPAFNAGFNAGSNPGVIG